MLKGFKEFLLRGNVVDLAVAVVIGTAFVAIVTAFTNGIINPILAVFGGNNEIGLGFRLVADKPATFVQVGPIITAALNFVIIAAVLYLVLVLPALHAKKRWGASDTPLTDSEVLVQIRDLLAEGQHSSGGRHEF
ncbi:large conductance mechanosensitive channel protein MscL [Nocardia sp. NBC_00565]|uniref:large conductance mechanosensitive channel protein MscL n=1 Tax=Nocardia sp. NBC_00565 TaxID=2975993 RepID=UPI002E81042C|nr:large conductance mechanosensitive channel protein MscL [Nocardia sp. NBC_00565]WUC00995.1 large conductance mechanosensitive channel protein MscL [Nocardia sp. NBC_00565]